MDFIKHYLIFILLLGLVACSEDETTPYPFTKEQAINLLVGDSTKAWERAYYSAATDSTCTAQILHLAAHTEDTLVFSREVDTTVCQDFTGNFRLDSGYWSVYTNGVDSAAHGVTFRSFYNSLDTINTSYRLTNVLPSGFELAGQDVTERYEDTH